MHFLPVDYSPDQCTYLLVSTVKIQKSEKTSVISIVIQSHLRSKEITMAMECFNSLLLKLREAHEREVEGEWKLRTSLATEIQLWYKENLKEG